MIQLQKVTLRRGDKLLFCQADLTIYAGQKVGIVGPNGVGKSSLFKLIEGELDVEHGTVSIPNDLQIAHIRQDMPQTTDTALNYALQGDSELTALNARLSQAEKKGDGFAIADIHTHLATIGGYEATARASKILRGLGFSHEEISQAVNEFSGGWRMRLNLAQVLLSRADVLLLDEPTNHLDLETIVWLENYLQMCPATILLISHDRDFLDKTCQYVVHLRNQQFNKYTGNYSTFEHEYALQLTLQQATFEKQQKKRAHMQKFIDRFRYKASKAKQAQSRLKLLEKMEQIDPVHQLNPFKFKFKTPLSAGDPMLQLRDVSVGYSEHIVLKGINFSLYNGDRIGLLGKNGAGKSTFIKLLAGNLTAAKGNVEKNAKLKIGYFAQHQLEQLNAAATPLSTLQALDTKLTESEIRRYLGGFNFQRQRVFQSIGNFSGGEKARLVLALIIWQRPNLLLLDEPTNHLDMEMRQALTDALQYYEGAVVLVSHDRYLIESSVEELWLIAEEKISPFSGDLNDYYQWLLKKNSF